MGTGRRAARHKDGSVGVWDQWWTDATTQVTPTLATALIPGGVVLLCLAVPRLWSVLRHAVTIAHEAGHAAVATLTGRRVSGIRLHADTSGLTAHVGSAKRVPLALTSFAGYPAPAVLGLGAAVLVGVGYAFALLWIAVVVLVLVLVQVRNVYGFLVMVVAIGGLGWLAWAGPDAVRVGVAYGLAWLLLLGAVRAVIELHTSRKVPAGRSSDADALARSTHIPGLVWVAVFWLVTVACAAGGAWLMLADTVG